MVGLTIWSKQSGKPNPTVAGELFSSSQSLRFPEYEAATQVWFDHHLKGEPTLAGYSKCPIDFPKGKLPKLEIKADGSREIVEVEVYFTQQGIMQKPGSKDDSSNTKHRFWKYCEPEKGVVQIPGVLSYLFSPTKGHYGFLPMYITEWKNQLPEPVIMESMKLILSSYLL